jgi:hypothetical protein
MEIINNYISSFYWGIVDLPKNIQIALVVSLVSFGLLIFFYIFLLTKRMVYIFYRSRDRYWNEQIMDLLNVFLSDVDDSLESDPVSKVLPEFRKLPLHKWFIKRMLYQQILNYHKNFTGHASEKLKELFLQLHLDEIVRKKLKSSRAPIKIKGIIDTAQLELTHFSPLVKKLLHHPSADIRIEAQAAYIILNKAHSFDFLGDVKEPIQDWHQLVLMDLMVKLNPNQFPHFSIWLNSENTSVVELCLKLIRHFQQFDAIENIIHLLEHPNDEIKLQCIQILGEFEAAKAEEALLDCYNRQITELQAPILKALGRINSGNQLEFLLKAAATPQFEIAYEASAALMAHGSKGIALLKHYHHLAEPMNLQIIDQLLGETNNKNHGNLA